jgi:hypothetical protein
MIDGLYVIGSIVPLRAANGSVAIGGRVLMRRKGWEARFLAVACVRGGLRREKWILASVDTVLYMHVFVESYPHTDSTKKISPSLRDLQATPKRDAGLGSRPSASLRASGMPW